MLTVAEPPTTVIVGGTVRRADVHVPILGAERHVILVGHGVGSVARESRHLQLVALFLASHTEVLVVGHPVVAVDVVQLDPQPSAVVAAQPVKSLIASPELVHGRAEASGVVVPRSVEVHRAVDPPAYYDPSFPASRQQRSTGSRRQKRQSLLLLAVARQRVHHHAVLVLHVFQLLREVLGSGDAAAEVELLHSVVEPIHRVLLHVALLLQLGGTDAQRLHGALEIAQLLPGQGELGGLSGRVHVQSGDLAFALGLIGHDLLLQCLQGLEHLDDGLAEAARDRHLLADVADALGQVAADALEDMDASSDVLSVLVDDALLQEGALARHQADLVLQLVDALV